MTMRNIYRHLTDARRRWLEHLDKRTAARRRSGIVARDCEILGWTRRLPSGHDELTPLGEAVLDTGRGDCARISGLG
jgi:hypothetical protein